MAHDTTIFIGSDHAGFALKERIKAMLAKDGRRVEDLGTHSEESVDYPTFARVVAEKVGRGEGEGVLICGTGIGMSIAANKVHGVRAALAKDEYMAEMARRHNNANILCMGGRTTAPELAEKITRKFFSTDFEGGRHERRVGEIHEMEKSC